MSIQTVIDCVIDAAGTTCDVLRRSPAAHLAATPEHARAFVTVHAAVPCRAVELSPATVKSRDWNQSHAIVDVAMVFYIGTEQAVTVQEKDDRISFEGVLYEVIRTQHHSGGTQPGVHAKFKKVFCRRIESS